MTHSLEASLVSALMHDNTLIDFLPNLSGLDFSDDLMGSIYESIKKINLDGKVADTITVSELLSPIRGRSVISEIFSILKSPYHPDNVKIYAQQILENSCKRKTLKMVENFYLNISASDMGFEQAKDLLLDEVNKIDSISNEEPQFIGSLGSKFIELLDKRMQSQNGLIGISTGFKELDRLTHGLCGGQLIVLGARPGNGKTTLAANIAMHVAKKKGTVAFFSLEMRDMSIYERFVIAESEIPASAFKDNSMTAEQNLKVLDVVSSLENLKISLVDAVDVQDIARTSRQIKKKHNLDLIVVDYLGLLLGGKHEHAHLVLGEITRTLKKLSIQLDVPILLLSQLNREIEKRNDSTPKLSDLRQSGNIEQDADIVMFLSQYDKDKPTSRLHGYGLLDIAKHREGELETIILRFEGQYNRFVETKMTVSEFEALKICQKKSIEPQKIKMDW